MEIDRNGLEVLEREECLRLLQYWGIGRIGLTSGALPVVLPVRYALAGDGIVLRTGRGTKLESATSKAVVAFEVDDVNVLDDPAGQARHEPAHRGCRLRRLPGRAAQAEERG